MEVHFVHYKTSYGGVKAAIAKKQPDGLAVTGFFFEATDSEVGATDILEITDHLPMEGHSNISFPLRSNS